MNTWNMFDPEITKEIASLQPRMAQPTSFKAQAKRELARRLKLEDEIKWLKQDFINLEIENDHLREFIMWPHELWDISKSDLPQVIMQQLLKRI